MIKRKINFYAVEEKFFLEDLTSHAAKTPFIRPGFSEEKNVLGKLPFNLYLSSSTKEYSNTNNTM